MNAVDFVKKHGWEKAVEVIKNRPPMNSARYRASDNKYSSTLSSGQAVCTVELKRLIESWELVERLGGLESSLNERDFRRKQNILQGHDQELSEAIRDVESVGGGV
ncbi:hypothetical protein [Acinetobacter bereziniae]|uniref:hypothetical protein n=1 Tax=Acinetobacter bereziniae TaxID=106648 RepID=UPI003009640E